MLASQQKPLHKNVLEEYFDGMVVEKRGAEGPSLDLNTLNQKTFKSDSMQAVYSTAIQYGMNETGSGVGHKWHVKSFPDNHFEVVGVYTDDGLKKSTKKPASKPKKKRSSTRKTMTDSSVESSLRRSKKTIRHLCYMLQPDNMATLTTRHPFVDADQFKRVASRFFGMVRLEIPDLQYIAVFERHMSKHTSVKKFGSLHAHMLVKGYVPYSRLIEMWRKAVQLELKNGDFEGANIDFNRSKNSKPRTMARYLSKYLTKDLDNEYYEPNKKRYWASKGIGKPETFTLFSPPATTDGIFRQMWTDIFSQDEIVMWVPDIEPGKPPIIWISSG